MEDSTKYINGAVNVLSKVWFYCLYILIGIVGMFSYNYLQGKKMSIWSAVAAALLAGFVGYLSCVWCYNHDLDRQAAYIVPIATLLSDKISTFIVQTDWRKIYDVLINKDK